MRATVAPLALLLLLAGAAEGWAPKQHAPIKFRRSDRREPAAPGVRDAPLAGFGAGEEALLAFGADGKRRRLQDPGKYDAEYATTWDESTVGLSAYKFDQPTSQGGENEAFGWAPAPRTWRDPDAPPTPAEMYPRLLEVDEETRMVELAAAWRRERGSGVDRFSSEWCRRSGIRPGDSGCSLNAPTYHSDDQDSRNSYVDGGDQSTFNQAFATVMDSTDSVYGQEGRR